MAAPIKLPPSAAQPRRKPRLIVVPGVLVVCDASIKSIIVKIDSEDHAFIVEELDDQTLVVKENMLSILTMRLDEVGAGAGAGADCCGKPDM